MGEVCDGESRGWEKCAVASAGEGAVCDGGGSEGGSSAMVRVRAEGGSDVLWLGCGEGRGRDHWRDLLHTVTWRDSVELC